MPFEECPICGGELIGQEVGKLLKAGVRIFFGHSRENSSTALMAMLLFPLILELSLPMICPVAASHEILTRRAFPLLFLKP
jgi:hypothetical protein